ncbi:VCBS repeat-containing protein [candidate division KSB1 bacterium]|nr:VCBS repeat-containing protein [candidate division KSB1 bacterium]
MDLFAGNIAAQPSAVIQNIANGVDNNVFTALQDGFYTVEITNGTSNCTSNFVQVEVLNTQVFPDIIIENVVSSTNCAGGTLDGAIDVFADVDGDGWQDVFVNLQGPNLNSGNVQLLMNNGDETFNVEPLPVEAQFSPIHAILVDDFNDDGFQDMLLGGNFYGVPPDQGRYDASYGSLLLGDGTGNFVAVSLQTSGFVASGEVRQIKSIQTASGEILVMAARSNDTVVIFRKRE